MKRRNHKDLVVWQKAMSLARTIHVLTRSFPPEELFGITSQLRRAAVSIASNIAEGAARATTREFIQFLYVARGSLAEIETQLELAEGAGYTKRSEDIFTQADEVGKLLNAVIRGLRRKLCQQQRRL